MRLTSSLMSRKTKFTHYKFSKTVKFFFVNRDQSITEVSAKVGDNLLEIAQKHEIEMEGACDGQKACSTCHCILEDKIYENLPEPDVIEEDLLDMAYGLTPTSRLGCQVNIDESFEGSKVELPKATRNFYVDGFVPKPH